VSHSAPQADRTVQTRETFQEHAKRFRNRGWPRSPPSTANGASLRDYQIPGPYPPMNGYPATYPVRTDV
jgi:hypothetical protein